MIREGSDLRELAHGLRECAGWLSTARRHSRNPSEKRRLLIRLESLAAAVQECTGIAPSFGIAVSDFYSADPGSPGPDRALAHELSILANLLDCYEGAPLVNPRRRWHHRRRSVSAQLGILQHWLQCNNDRTVPNGSRSPLAAVGASSEGGDSPTQVRVRSPHGNPEHRLFSTVARRTHCLFADRSVAWALPETADPDDGQSMRTLAARLRGFTRAAKRDRLDCFAASFPSSFGATVPALAGLTNAVLRQLTRLDGVRRPFGRPERPGWRFVFAGELYFVLAMGPCYPKDHARHVFGVDRTFLVFQPDIAFERAAGRSVHGLISRTVRERIRAKYRAAGMEYDLAHTESPVEAHRFVKPIDHGAAPVDWWNPTGNGR